jgi:DNA polymerase-3 subunit epsilon
MREIVFDTETTGLDPLNGDRLVEIGCIELINRFPTGNVFHRYINPERDMPEGAFKVHGLSAEFLRGHPVFMAVADEFLDFVGDAQLVAHNGFFDLGFINAELGLVPRPIIGRERIIDTLILARRKHPGAQNKLDDLCARYRIDNSRRTKHGALLDAELLAEVYIELTGARQAMLGLSSVPAASGRAGRRTALPSRPAPLAPRLTAAECEAHRAFVGSLGEDAIWKDYLPAEAGE